MQQLQTVLARAHRMPFGATVLPGDKVLFRLWAPDATQVEVYRADNESITPMTQTENGWFELTAENIRPGARYGFYINGNRDFTVPDPASRFQPDDVHGLSEVIDPEAFRWEDGAWQGRPWQETVLYELHVGTFTPEGTFKAIIPYLDKLVALGVTAIELMPVSDFPGSRNWGYDGVLPYAPDSAYGRPEDLKALIQAAHAKGLMVFLDVVYNHFGPEGNYLHVYAKSFFNEKHQTPWGAAINFDGHNNRPVRDYFIHNTLYWLEEYHFDGLRFDAVHAIEDDSRPDILEELSETVYKAFGHDRHIHLVLENDDNEAHYLSGNPQGECLHFSAQWNDDSHHAFHVLTAKEKDGYYADYADKPARHMARCLTEGFAYQADPSNYRDGVVRGEPSKHLPPWAFVNFIQNHDQVGNRAFGERLTLLSQPETLHAAVATWLLSPAIPMLFMGEEWGSRQPFPFFCEFGPELAQAVTEGRRKEFAKFPQFSDPAKQAQIPDPNAESTYQSAILNWAHRESPEHAAWVARYQSLLQLRKDVVVPLLKEGKPESVSYELFGDEAFMVQWQFKGRQLQVFANFSDQSAQAQQGDGDLLYETQPGAFQQLMEKGEIPERACVWAVKSI